LALFLSRRNGASVVTLLRERESERARGGEVAEGMEGKRLSQWQRDEKAEREEREVSKATRGREVQ
jgi:hypothetical protein